MTQRTGPVLEVDGVRKSFGPVHALAGVDLDVAPGEVAALLGHNGAGKTTLVSIIAGLLDADAGSVAVLGQPMGTTVQALRREIGLAPQDLALYPVVTVLENLRFFAELYGLRRRQCADAIERAAAVVGISGLLGRLAGQLSGGERRRVHTAIAMLHRPSLLILDEPTAGSDVESRNSFLVAVKEAAAEGAAVLYSTHYLSEVESLDATVTILEAGRVVARGSVAELVRTHAQSAVEITFEHDAPDLRLPDSVGPHEIRRDGHRLLITTPEPTGMVGAVIKRLPRSGPRLLSVNVLTPSLEAAYLGLTGRRYGAADQHAESAAEQGEEA